MRLPALSFRTAVAVIAALSFGLLIWRGRPSRQLGPIEPLLFASGLDQPRGLAFGSDGTLYVAEAGVSLGGRGAGRVSALSPSGARATLVDGLPAASPGDPLFVQGGPSALVRPGGTGDTPLFIATGAQGSAPLGDLLRAGAAEGGWRTEPVTAFHTALTAAAQPASAWGASVTRDGQVYLTFPAANLLVSARPATAAGTGTVQVQPVTGFIGAGETNPFPTATAIGPDGAVYVTLLGGSPPRPGAGSIVRVDSSGRWQPVYEALSFPVALAFAPDGQLWVLEYASGYDSRSGSYTPRSGRLVAVGPSPLRRRRAVIAINAPTALAFSSAGDAYFTENGVDSASGTGRVLRAVTQSLRALQ